jgi:ferritin-like metal-binding protein YciE
MKGAHDMPTQDASLGFNRTGIGTSPIASEQMMEGMDEFPPTTPGDESMIGVVRGEFAREAGTLGSVPPPLSVKGMVKTTVQAIKGSRPTQFIDKLGERLAFERSGVRLYEALISKFESHGGFEGGPNRAQLEENMREEHEHFRLLTEVVTRLGGDPTVVTPSADLHATMTKGVMEVMVDARTTFTQCLEALLVAELSDNECWESLIELARETGEQSVVTAFEKALEEEADHLEDVRAWIAAAQNRKSA